MTKERIIWLVSCIAISLVISFWFYRKQGKKNTEATSLYIAAKAEIIDVQPARMSRYGMKTPRYGVRFSTKEGKPVIQYNCELSNTWKLNDTLTIYYDPNNPNNPITDKH